MSVEQLPEVESTKRSIVGFLKDKWDMVIPRNLPTRYVAAKGFIDGVYGVNLYITYLSFRDGDLFFIPLSLAGAYCALYSSKGIWDMSKKSDEKDKE